VQRLTQAFRFLPERRKLVGRFGADRKRGQRCGQREREKTSGHVGFFSS